MELALRQQLGIDEDDPVMTDRLWEVTEFTVPAEAGTLDDLKYLPYLEKLTIHELDAGLHFLLRVDTSLTDGELVELLGRSGIRIRALSDYYHGPVPEAVMHHLVVNYSGIREETLEELINRI